MDAEQVLAFRLARSGLAGPRPASLAAAAACPASDFSRDAALMALSARCDGLTRERYEEAVDHGDLVVAQIVRGAIHVLAPGDFGLYGRALIASDDDELAGQLGRQFKRLTAEHSIAPADALAEATQATKETLHGARAVTKNELHDELRGRVRSELMPWCEGCQSHHVAPMLWRYATIAAGARLDSGRRYLLGSPGRRPAAAEAVRRFLSFYGPATAGDFADWAGVARPHGDRLWRQIEGELSECSVGRRASWVLAEDAAALESPPRAEGVRLIGPGDPYLAKPNRALLAPDGELRKRLFRPVASPGAVLKDGRLVGLWRVKSKGKKAEVAVEKLGRLARADLEPEAQRIADLRGADRAEVVIA